MNEISSQRTEHNFFEQMKSEHGNLVGTLGQIRHEMASGQHTIPGLRKTILRFCELIEGHFAREEAGGYLRDITDPSPELTGRAADLLREHTTLRDSLQTIRDLAKDGNQSDAWLQDLGREFERFAQQLMVHEAHEDDLMNEGGLGRQASQLS